jgi:hypothetical protein
MSRRKIAIVGVVLMLLIGGTIWALMGRADGQVEKVKQMQDEMFAGGPPKPEQFERMGR